MTAAEYVPDNYDQFERYEREQAELEERWPKCPVCGELLEDEAYRIDDALICWDCAHDWLEEQKVAVEIDMDE